MNKKLIFIGMIVLALVLTTGNFAYTYTNGTTSLSANMADGAWATYSASASQPNWDGIMPMGGTASVIIVPVAAGDYTTIIAQYPASGENWDKVDDQPSDENATYISTGDSAVWQGDLYEMSNLTGFTGAETITNVTFNVRFASAGSWYSYAIAEFSIGGAVYSGPTEQYLNTAFKTISWQVDTNPATGAAWTIDDINSLQAGLALKGSSRTKPAICTQVYVQVNYETTGVVQGEVPTGNLYDVTPDPEYAGDMIIKVYLTNAADLLKAYQYLNMKVYTYGSLEPVGTPDYKVLSLENGVVGFICIGESASVYAVSVTGGSYALISDDPSTWGTGYSITPEFYCEVTQR